MTLEHKINTSFIRRIGNAASSALSALSGVGKYVVFAGLSIAALMAYSCGKDAAQSIPEYKDIQQIEDVAQQDIAPDTHPYSKTCLIDKDNDNYGIKENNVFVGWDEECPKGYKILEPPFDCNDKIKSLNPGAKELCNNLDDNCNGEIDEGLEMECMTECGKGKMVCKEGKYLECDAPTVCCTPGSITDAIECPYEPHVFLFVIDDSGSMSTSDPSKLRYYGVIGFVEKTSIEDSTGLIIYSDSASITGSITNNKQEISSYLQQVISQYPNGATNIPYAMSLAITSISDFYDDKVIILLTDGQSNVGAFSPISIKSKAEAYDIKVFTLGLGYDVNAEELQALATNDGKYYFIESAEEIAAIYTTIFNQTTYKSWKECDKKTKEWIQKLGECN